jgi:cystathionine beta-lyase
VFSFVLSANDNEPHDTKAAKFPDSLSLSGIGYSWGGFQSLALQVHLGDRKVLKPREGGPLIRLQIGLKDVTDLVKEQERAFAACRI